MTCQIKATGLLSLLTIDCGVWRTILQSEEADCR